MIEDKYKVAAKYIETGVEGIERTGIKVLAMRDRLAAWTSFDTPASVEGTPRPRRSRTAWPRPSSTWPWAT